MMVKRLNCHSPYIRLHPMYRSHIHELKLSVRPFNGLLNGCIQYVGVLIKLTRGELIQRCINFGRVSADEVEDALAIHNLELNPRKKTWIPGRWITTHTTSSND